MTSRTSIVTLSVLLTMFWAPVLTRTCAKHPNNLDGLEGEWVYTEDRTEGRPIEQQGPPMSATFSFRVEPDAVILVQGHGSGHRDVRVAFDGSVTKVPGKQEGTLALYSGSSADGEFAYQTEFVRSPGKPPEGRIRKEFKRTKEGLLVRVQIGLPVKYESVAVYRLREDIAMPSPTEATIDDLDWLAGNWGGFKGTSGTTSVEERWSPPRGGAMLCTARTVSRNKMTFFEFLRVVERDGGLVYVAQPLGRPPTEFIATEISPKHVVFDNPRHDYPQRITYRISDEDSLSVSIGFINGGSPRPTVFHPETR
ncbi:MAG: DUF6265 family protein [Planctomycetota bacterium]